MKEDSPQRSENNSCNSLMIEACSNGNIDVVNKLIREEIENCNKSSEHTNTNREEVGTVVSRQNEETGLSPLMASARYGHLSICELLLEHGAPWNAVDRYGQCAGNYATDNQHWNVVNLLVDAGTKAELILGASIRNMMTAQKISETEKNKEEESDSTVPVEHKPCTKPDYLSRNVRYNQSKTALLDDDDDAVMMEWERPLMKAHASIITGETKGSKRVLNVGYGMGIIDNILQNEWKPALHIIIEAHPAVYEQMKKDGWDTKPGVRICFGKWQGWMPKLIEEGIILDGIFYDTYGEHFTDLEDFHQMMSQTLEKPNGIYSFFNGLAPDNIFFHGVACNCVKLQLAKLGLDSEFAQCEIQVKEKEWEGVRRKYWHGRETYYLPIITWNKNFIGKGDKALKEPDTKKSKT